MMRNSSIIVINQRNYSTKGLTGLWCIHGATGVSYVLRRVEDSECQSGEEIPGRQQSGNWSQAKSCAICGT